MDRLWRETFLMHAKTDEFKYNIKKSHKIVNFAIKKFRNPYIAFSGGKDSLCMLHLIKNLCKDIKIYHIKWGKYLIPEEIEDEIINQVRKMGWEKSLEIITSRRLDTLSKIWRKGKSKDYYKVAFGLLAAKIKKNKNDAVFLGLRSEESLKRKRRIDSTKNNILYKKGHLPEIYPISHWNWKDVWAYILKYKLPYLQIYNKYSKLYGWNKTRFGTFFDTEFDFLGASNIQGVLDFRFKNI